jgi:LacI family gluconate utilization system Gnt-I transcriptional repressor
MRARREACATERAARPTAADLNYVPNRIAGTLATMTSELIGIVIPSVGNTVVPGVLAGANAVLEGAGFQPVIGVSNYDPSGRKSLSNPF